MNFPEVEIKKTHRLAFTGKPLVKLGDSVATESVIANVLLPLPRVFFMPTFRILPKGSPDGFRVEWLKNKGDNVIYDEPIVRFYPEVRTIDLPSTFENKKIIDPIETRTFKSPWDGIIDDIHHDTGNVILHEEMNYDDREATVNVGQRVGVRGRSLKKLLRKHEGEFIEKGSLLAMRAGSAKIENAAIVDRVHAPISGRIKEIDVEKGTVRIERDFEEIEIKAGIIGTVTSVEEKSVEITGKGSKISGMCGLGENAFGRIRVPVDSYDSVLSENCISENDKGKILIAGSYTDYSALERAQSVGVAGIITGGVDQIDVVNLIDEDFAVTITGKENLQFALIITERFGSCPMDRELFDYLKSMENRWAYLETKTHMRAGVIRPEIFVMGSAA